MAAKPKTFAMNVAVAGTAQPLSSTLLYVRELLIQANGNTSNIYVGGVDVDASNGIFLEASRSIALSDFLVHEEEEYINLQDVYIDADVNGEGVRVMYIVR